MVSYKAIKKRNHLFKKAIAKLLPKDSDLIVYLDSRDDGAEQSDEYIKQVYKHPDNNDLFSDFSHFVFILTLVWMLSPLSFLNLPKDIDYILYKIVPVATFIYVICLAISFYNLKKCVQQNLLVTFLTLLANAYVLFVIGSIFSLIPFISFGFILSFWFAHLYVMITRFFEERSLGKFLVYNVYVSLPFLVMLNDRIMSVYLLQSSEMNLFSMSPFGIFFFLLMPAIIGLILFFFYLASANVLRSKQTRHLPCILFFNGFLVFYIISLFVAFFWFLIPTPSEEL